MKKPTKSQTAKQAFDAKRDEVLRGIESLQAHLIFLETRFKEEGEKNWGFVGDLTHINEMLDRAMGVEK